MNFCIPKQFIEPLKKKMKEVGGVKLTNLEFPELIELFSSVLDERNAIELAKSFKLAVISKRNGAIKNWLVKNLSQDEVETYKKSTISAEKQKVLDSYKQSIKNIKEEYKQKQINKKERARKIKEAQAERAKQEGISIEDKIKNNIDRLTKKLQDIKTGKIKKEEKRNLTQEELDLHQQIKNELAKLSNGIESVHEKIEEEVIEKALGVSISASEVETINELSEKMFEAEKKTPDNPFLGYHSDYFKAQTELSNYLDTVNEMSTLSVLSKVIFRGNLLFAAKSIITNIVGNIFGGISEKVVNTAIERKFSGVNSELIKDYAQFAIKMYIESGIDVVRTIEVGNSSTVLGEHFKGIGGGEGFIRDYGRFVEQYVLKLGQGAPDIGFASLHFADNVNVLSTKIADAKGLTGEAHKKEAKRLFLLATSLKLDEKNPAHQEALQIKRSALQYALTSTYQNDTNWSKTALAVRRAVDEYTGELNLGTNLSPFVKTLVNIAKLSIDMTGVTLPIELPRLVFAYRQGDIETIKESINVVTRAGLGMTLAILLASAFDDDEYLPDYIVATSYQKEIAKLSNASYNSIKIGNKWVSLGYFGTFGYALAGMLGAKQQKTISGKVSSYYSNVAFQLRQTPVIQQLADGIEYLIETKQYNKSGDEIVQEAVSGTANFFLSRLIPAFVSDIAKGFDDKERYTRYGLEGFADQLKNKIPFWRETLPPKYNALGDEIPTEKWYMIMLTGARIKTAPSDNTVYKELVRLSSSGENVSIKLDTFKDVKTAKELLSFKEYNELTGQLQKELTNTYANIMGTDTYKETESAEDQKKLLTDHRKEVVNKVLRDYGYFDRIREYQEKE